MVLGFETLVEILQIKIMRTDYRALDIVKGSEVLEGALIQGVGLPRGRWWAWEFHPLRSRCCLSQTLRNPESYHGDWPHMCRDAGRAAVSYAGFRCGPMGLLQK